MSKQIRFRCTVCGKEFSPDETAHVCHACGQVGTLDILLDMSSKPLRNITHPLNMWNQRDLLPVSDSILPGLAVIGGTPLIGYNALQHVADAHGIARMCIKNDGLNLTASLKDRASAMVVQHAIQDLTRNVIATASTGNAAAALAGCCAAVPEAEAVIFVPKNAPKGKIAQMVVFGATVMLVDGDYDTAFDLCWEACEAFGWYNRSTGINPYTTAGKKTVVHEIAMQLQWHMPDVIMVSVGDGSIIGGVYEGCRELFELKWIDQMPRIIGVQAAGSDALVDAWERDLDASEMELQPAQTIADSISSGLPRDRAKALRAVRMSDGAMVRVSDDEILAAIPALARQTGVFAEPAAAATYAGLSTAIHQGYVKNDDSVCLLITGNGLKDVQAAMDSVADAGGVFTVAPTLKAVEAVINDQRK